MQGTIEPLVLEEHQREVVFDHLFPPATYMYVSLSLKTSFFIHVVYMSKIIFIIWIWHMLFYAGFYWGIGAWREPDWWPTFEELAYMFMYHFLLYVILMIQRLLFKFIEIV